MTSDNATGARTGSVHDWAWGVATMLGTGHLPLGPGTWASAITVVLWYAIANSLSHGEQIAAAILWAALAVVAGIPAATREARRCGVEDPGHVVIDEMAGQIITLIGAPVQWKTLLVGFILFRCFDILKPPPVRQLERLPGGVGIVMDDVGAGIYAAFVLQMLKHFLTVWFG